VTGFIRLSTGAGENEEAIWCVLYHAVKFAVKLTACPHVEPFFATWLNGSWNNPVPFNPQPKELPMFDLGTVTPKFSLGQIVSTPNALNSVSHQEITAALKRHVRGDWGNLDAEDLQSNERALQFGGRLFSSYLSSQNVKFWIITECDRSATTVLLPEDY
jgi:hypothetical protein